MNITPKFYCLHMLKLPLSRSYSNLSQKTRLLKLLSIGTNKGLLINRTSSAIARPKELDDLKSKWHKKRKEGTFDGEDEIGLYGFFLLVKFIYLLIYCQSGGLFAIVDWCDLNIK